MPAEKDQSKVVVITGGASGIGLETARMLLEQGGHKVLLVGKEEDRTQEAVKALKSKDAFAYACDLSDPKQIKKLIAKILATHKELYGLINNAGVYPFGGLSTTSEAQWDETFNINLKAAFLMIQGLAPALSKNKGGARVVNVSSTAGILPNHFALAYSVSKAALIQLTKTLAKELGATGVTVNCVCPGIVRSPMHEAYHRNKTELESFYAKRGSTFPAGRVGETADVANAIRFLMSADASWITGETMVIDGGRLLL